MKPRAYILTEDKLLELNRIANEIAELGQKLSDLGVSIEDILEEAAGEYQDE
ncbi:hypothetical protein D3OALGA1CA_546 [Olavius algarvensis associated proteobacterium Delta 3]|nr:hypothetical protein D3OALGA1CA_546 [Olavius algarvensis associated proteobacterium Delta 3]CAB5138863.1 hypothetical protein D3OALGB2SA_4106 [Olavius algarvensis associated proteobacterium Delta 3]